ncbi:carboxypeptidase-like regulatory domain-containing protein, partial [Patescibacteria group bacterium]|nr:carboxypeptidase-like regulatory domain-containing protein [Patescibacteria group bacterium]
HFQKSNPKILVIIFVFMISTLVGNFFVFKPVKAMMIIWGNIYGTIREAETQEPIEGASIELFKVDALDEVWDMRTSNTQGEYAFEGDFFGDWLMKVSKPGYLTQSQNVIVNSWSSVTLDFYLEPEAQEPEIDPLILQYEPILYLHPDETYQPMNVEAYVGHCSLWDSHGAAADELLKDESILNPVTLDDLNFEGIDSSGYYLQFVEDLAIKWPDAKKASIEYEQMKNNGEVKYARYVIKMTDKVEETGEEYIVLQYWYFYAFNDWQEKGGLNNHEGDWEVVMIFISKEDGQPKYIAYSSHHNRGRIEEPWQLQYTSVRKSWDSSEVVKQNDQVISFVGIGSHANYPNDGDNGIHPIPGFPDDRTSTNGLHLDNTNWEYIVVFKENELPKWVTGYRGKWGVFVGMWGFNGCNHLYPSQYNRFTEPIKWAGVDKVGQQTVWETGVYVLNFIKQETELVFDEAVNIGTTILVDLHDEIIQIGKNIKEISFLPHFWDIESNLENNTFNAEATFGYDPEEIDIMGLEEKFLDAFGLDGIQNLWQKIPSVIDLENNTISFNTTHFSRYAIGVEKWQDITDEVQVIKDRGWGGHIEKIIEKGKKFLEEFTGWGKQDLTRRVRIRNKSEEDIKGPLRLVIDSIDKEGVTVKDPDGYTFEGKPYFDISDTYPQCRFIGDEKEIKEILGQEEKNFRRYFPSKLKDKIKKIFQDKGMPRIICGKLIEKKPEIAPYIEYFLPPKMITTSQLIEFDSTLDQKKPLKFDFEVKILNKVAEE